MDSNGVYSIPNNQPLGIHVANLEIWAIPYQHGTGMLRVQPTDAHLKASQALDLGQVELIE